MINKTIVLYWAFDRYNYWDILFPIVLDYFIRDRDKNTNVIYAWLIESDLSSLWWFQTRSIFEVLENEKVDELIMVWWDVLWATYTIMNSHYHANIINLVMLFLGSKLWYYVFDQIVKIVRWWRWDLPWVIDFFDWSVSYISISWKIEKIYEKKWLETLKSANFVGVRDSYTFNYLRENWINTQMWPDIVCSMSSIFSKKTLLEESNTNISTYIQDSDKYLAFQIWKYYWKGNVDIIVNELETIYKKHEIVIVMVPIGYAAFHEDDKILKVIHEKLISRWVKSMFFEHTLSIYDIAALISHSNCYIWTSLHGAITWMSYAVPVIWLNKKIKKLDYFLRDWSDGSYSWCISYDSITDWFNWTLVLAKNQNVLHLLSQKINRNAIKFLNNLINNI